MYQYICKYCGVDFVNKNKGSKYCSQVCCKADSKKGAFCICANCGKECYVANYKIATRKVSKVFCCWECNMDYQRKRRPTRTCKNCGKAFRKKCRSDARYCSVQCKLNSTENLAQLAEMRRRQAIRKVNKLERAGYAILDELSLQYEPQFIFGRYVADAYVKDLNLIVQFDGDYWHGNISRFPNLTQMQLKQKEVDARANHAAAALGYRVLRIWESDIKNTKKIKQIFVTYR